MKNFPPKLLSGHHLQIALLALLSDLLVDQLPNFLLCHFPGQIQPPDNDFLQAFPVIVIHPAPP